MCSRRSLFRNVPWTRRNNRRICKRPCTRGSAKRSAAARCSATTTGFCMSWNAASLVGGPCEHVIDSWAFTPRTLRILYAPCEGQRRYLGLMAPLEAGDAATLPINPEIWASCFPAFASTLRLIGARGRHDAYETTRLEAWSAGRVAIGGDAAHAMPPTLAQGACCAIMNALSLAVFVSRGSPIENALQRWEAQERGLTDHTQARSAELARTRALGSGMQWDDVGLR